MRRLLVTLAFATIVGCAPPADGARTSGVLVSSGDALPDGHLLDVRGPTPLVALTSASGETEIHGPLGRVAPPIPGHERALLRGLREAADGAIWACHDEGAAVYVAGAWTSHEFAAFGVVEDLTGGCTSLDARSASEVYLGVGANICSYDGAAWDCFPFGTSRSVTLSPGNLWFVRPSARYDDLTVIDTVSRATPGLVRLGEVGSTEALVPVPGAEAVIVVGAVAGARTLRSAIPDGTFTTLPAREVVPVSASERFLLTVAARPALECAGLLCGEGATWSELVVMHDVGGTVTEVGHLTTNGPAGVPWRALLDHGELRVRTPTELLALP